MKDHHWNMESRWEHKNPQCQSRKNIFKSVVFGIVVLAAGVALLLKNVEIITPEDSEVIFSWQMLIIAIGFINLFGRGTGFGFILMLVGGFFLASEFYGLPVEFSKVFWPALLILAGIMVVFGSMSNFWKKQRWFKSSDNIDVIDEVSVFGGAERNIVSNNFKGGKILAVFGGSKFNITKSVLAEGKQELDLVLVFGGTHLIVPPDWNVKIETMNILGGFSDKRITSIVDPNKTLIIKGIAIFGGGEISSL